MTRLSESDKQRFWAKVDKSSSCWIWTAYRNKDGYGKFGIGNKVVSAHRTAYQLLVGQIPNGKSIDHLCRNRGCVNPSHMEVVTHKTNVLRGISPTSINARKTHCARGHLFSEENTLFRKNGHRTCLMCRRQQANKKNANKADLIKRGLLKPVVQRVRCGKGHVIDEQNRYIDPYGYPVCVECRKENSRAYRRRKKAIIGRTDD